MSFMTILKRMVVQSFSFLVGIIQVSFNHVVRYKIFVMHLEFILLLHLDLCFSFLFLLADVSIG